MLIKSTTNDSTIAQALTQCGLVRVANTNDFIGYNSAFDDIQWRAIASTDTNVANQVFKFQVQ